MNNAAAAPQHRNIWDPAMPADNFEVEPDEEMEEEGPEREADGALNGGVAVPPHEGVTKEQSECDLILYVNCIETIDLVPNHPVLRPSVTVSIGLDKTTKLGAVFSRYVMFCNEHSSDKIDVSDLEFVHCQLLNSNDTAEMSALMKNDKIRARSVRTTERKAEAEQKRLERESDREYFRQLRQLMPETGWSKGCDVILDCQGKHLDESGRNQQVLCTTVRAHSAILAKRCPWLGHQIKNAREELNRQNAVAILDTEGGNSGSDEDVLRKSGVRRFGPDKVRSSGASTDEDEDYIGFLPYPVERDSANRRHEGIGRAAEIENDDDEDEDDEEDGDDDDDASPASSCMRGDDSRDSASPVFATNQSGMRDMLWITLENYSPEPAKLLLEYCYTNRVISLGRDAFVQACKTKRDGKGPTPPFHQSYSDKRSWPNDGRPDVSFSVALAGISLAEEASMPRLSLMCEIAASNLVTSTNVVDALSTCTAQKKRSGNPLPRLRSAAMRIMLESGTFGTAELFRTPSFKRALEEKGDLLVPAILVGTVEAVDVKKKDSIYHGVKRDRNSWIQGYFEDIDQEDAEKRESERSQYNKKRKTIVPHSEKKGSSGVRWDVAVLCKDSLRRMATHDCTAALRRSTRQQKAKAEHGSSRTRRRNGSRCSNR